MPLSLNALDVHDSRNPVYSSTVCLDCFIEILSLRRSGDIGQTFGVKFAHRGRGVPSPIIRSNESSLLVTNCTYW